MPNLLHGIYDLHIHTSPDVVPRKCTDLELAERLINAGMRGCAIKCHFGDTAARAALLQMQFPSLSVVGGVTLNRALGGLNPHAVESSAKMGGRMVWFPTIEARSFQSFLHRDNPSFDLTGFITVCDDNGALLPEAVQVLEAAARNKMIVGTGHVSSDEGMKLVHRAAELGCKIVLTHVDNPANCYTIEQQKEAVALGAYVEHSYFTTFYNRTPIEQLAAEIRAVGCDHVVLTTDFGQLTSPHSDEGMQQYADLLLTQGFAVDELIQMMALNPEQLIW